MHFCLLMATLDKVFGPAHKVDNGTCSMCIKALFKCPFCLIRRGGGGGGARSLILDLSQGL